MYHEFIEICFDLIYLYCFEYQTHLKFYHDIIIIAVTFFFVREIVFQCNLFFDFQVEKGK